MKKAVLRLSIVLGIALGFPVIACAALLVMTAAALAVACAALFGKIEVTTVPRVGVTNGKVSQ